MIRVQCRPNEPLEAALRRFKRQCNLAGIFRLAKKHGTYEKPSEQKRREGRERLRNIRIANRKANQQHTGRTSSRRAKVRTSTVTPESARRAAEGEIDAALAGWCRDRPAADMADRLCAAGIAAAVVASPADLAKDPQLAAWEHFQTRPRGDGSPAHHEACRFRLSLTPAEVRRAAPDYGRDTDAVLRDRLGMGRAQIEALRAAGVLT